MSKVRCGKSKSKLNNDFKRRKVQKIKDEVTKLDKMTILTLQVKVFFLHVYLCKALIAFCCSSAVPNVKWSHGLPLLGDRT
jgi:hypothetical protein